MKSVPGTFFPRVALGLNPACSSELWNTLGDCLYEGGQLEEARRAYERVLRVYPGDVKGRYNLAWVDVRQRDYRAALGRIAEALALDATGEFYDRLVRKQAEVLGLLAQRQQQHYLLLANRVSKLPTPADAERKAAAPPAEAPVKENPKPPTDPPVQRS
jgi:tetratricopeptide (TPR) repeat protein